jgi:hypothetical protein
MVLEVHRRAQPLQELPGMDNVSAFHHKFEAAANRFQ